MEVSSDGRIESFVEKPESPRIRLAFSGIVLANSSFFDVIPQVVPSDLGFDVFPRLAGTMFAYLISDYLLDIGTIGKYELA